MNQEIAEKLKSLESKYSYNQDEVYYFNSHRSSDLVLSLQNRFETFDESIIPEIFKDFGEAESWTVNQSFGTGHIIIFVSTKDGKEYVLRTNYGIAEPEKYMQFEKYFAQQYESVGIPTAKVLHSDISREKYPFDYQIMEKLGGYDLKTDPDITEEQYEMISQDLGKVVAKQFLLPIKGFGRIVLRDSIYQGNYNTHNEYLSAYVDHDLDVMELFEIIDHESNIMILNFFKSEDIKNLFVSTSSYLVHHDLADHNIRVKNGKLLAIYDWENVVAFDPLSELGSIPTWLSRYPRAPGMIIGFLESYGHMPENFELKLSVYKLRTMLWKANLALKGEKLSHRHIDYLRQALQECGLDIIINSDHLTLK